VVPLTLQLVNGAGPVRRVQTDLALLCRPFSLLGLEALEASADRDGLAFSWWRAPALPPPVKKHIAPAMAATETGKPFGVVWHTLRKGEVRYFDSLAEARAFAVNKMGKGGMVVEAPNLEATRNARKKGPTPNDNGAE